MNRKIKKSKVNDLVVCYIIIMFVIILMYFHSFSFITKQLYKNELSNTNISIEEKIEIFFGIVGTRVVYVSISILLASLLILLILIKKILKPIKELSNATKKIASRKF